MPFSDSEEYNLIDQLAEEFAEQLAAASGPRSRSTSIATRRSPT